MATQSETMTLRAVFTDSSHMPLPLAVGLLSGLRDYLHLHAMADLDLRQAFGGDMRGVGGNEFMSAYFVAQNLVHQVVVQSIRPAPLEVVLTIPAGTTPPPSYIDGLVATLSRYQEAHQDGVALRRDAAARQAIQKAVVSGRGPLPRDPTPQFSATLESAVYALVWLSRLNLE